MNEKIDVLNELGEFTGDVATIDECHSTGYWRRSGNRTCNSQNTG